MTATNLEITPQKFGRYVLLDRIGSGGMAEVYRAVMPGAEGFQRTFVVKRILAELCQAEDFVEMFVQEANICSLLHHPNIVEVFDFGRADDGYFLTMEYLRGRDLATVLRKLRERNQACPAPVAALIAHQVASGLGYAHGLCTPDGQPHNIVHRDVSPGNIICLRTGGVKLLDFGIAKALGNLLPETTGQGIFKGKLSYMAPERVKQEPVDGRSDLFSLGVVLWEMLAGRRLFRGKEELDTMRKVLETPVPPPSSLRPDIPTALDAIVLRALERDPANRYATGQDMADDLEQVLEDTKHQSKLLPHLLRDLFGADVMSTQLQLSNLMPESLSDSPVEQTLVSDAPGTILAGASSRPASGRTRRLAAMGAAAVSLSLAGMFLLGAFDNRSRPGGLRVGPGASVGTAPEQLGPQIFEITALTTLADPKTQGTSEPAARAGAEPASFDVAPAEVPEVGRTRKRPTRVQTPPGQKATGIDRNRIGRGLSIDPFAEAAARNSGRP